MTKLILTLLFCAVLCSISIAQETSESSDWKSEVSNESVLPDYGTKELNPGQQTEINEITVKSAPNDDFDLENTLNFRLYSDETPTFWLWRNTEFFETEIFLDENLVYPCRS